MDDKLKAAREQLQAKLKAENEAAKRANAEELRRAQEHYDLQVKNAQTAYQKEQAVLEKHLEELLGADSEEERRRKEDNLRKGAEVDSKLDTDKINKLRRKPRRWRGDHGNFGN